MTEQQIQYDRPQLKQSGDGLVAAHENARTQLNNTQAQIQGLGEWWNPNKDPNDLIGGLLGGCFTAVHEMMMSTGHQNLDVLHGHGQAMQVMSGNMTGAEEANTGLSGPVQA
ncbi:hypothetical protein OG417_41780 [Actinoallomurus sp. NBC_01490]|jgi:hypothetical protein|uniref:hypothetical protein n=1 Tax=Actinoallomurus sp. NBC_01490 TaxID=2903557 RepID=UPI002E2FDD84|nr:hypothetical protein [Actinoallomurus sp. NBC_01490]